MAEVVELTDEEWDTLERLIGTPEGREFAARLEARQAERAHRLAVEILTAMGQDCGPIAAEPYASWAKALAEFVVMSRGK